MVNQTMSKESEECLICLSTSWHPMDPIFSYVERLKIIFGDTFEFEAVGIPKHICSSCKILLRSMVAFMQQFEASKKQLQRRLDNAEVLLMEKNCAFTSEVPRISQVFSAQDIPDYGTPTNASTIIHKCEQSRSWESLVNCGTTDTVCNEPEYCSTAMEANEYNGVEEVPITNNNDDENNLDRKDLVFVHYNCVDDIEIESTSDDGTDPLQIIECVDTTPKETNSNDCDSAIRFMNSLDEETPKNPVVILKKLELKKKCPVCNMFVLNLSRHLLRHSKNTIRCPICKKSIKLSYFRSHLIAVHPTEDVNSSIFKTTLKKLKHMKNQAMSEFRGNNKTVESIIVEPGKKKINTLSCKKCGTSFKSAMTRKTHEVFQHMNTSTDDEKSEECEFCHLKFANRDLLALHSVVHINARYFCKCKALFASSEFLRKHCFEKHRQNPKYYEDIEVNGKEKIQLEKDGAEMLRVFLSQSWESQLEVCPICDKSTNDLRSHLKCHTGVKPHCPKCGRVLANLKSYSKHMIEIHQQERKRHSV